MSEQNKATLRRMINEVVAGGNLSLIDELVATDFVHHNPLNSGLPASTGREFFKRDVASLRAAFPDLTFIIEDLLADGDKVVARVRASGTHRGEFGGIPATGKRIADIDSVSIVRFADGRLAERWNVTDRVSMLQQLGVLPAPKAAGA